MKGILFKPEMHVAIRQDIKRVTRRVIDPQPVPYEVGEGRDKGWGLTWKKKCGGGADWLAKYARYKAGETYYVKEAHAFVSGFDNYLTRGIPKNASVVYRYDPETYVPEIHSTMQWGKWRSPLFLPEWAARTFIRITDVRAERLQSITEEDAKAEGCDLTLLRSMLEPLEAKAETSDCFWLENDEGGSAESSDWCHKCIDKAHRKYGTRKYRKCCAVSPESDSGKYCENCGMILDYTLTDYGCTEEWEHFKEHGIRLNPDEAYAAMRMLAGGDYMPKGATEGQIARLCYRTLWDSINNKNPWASNCYVWRYSFERVKPRWRLSFGIYAEKDQRESA